MKNKMNILNEKTLILFFFFLLGLATDFTDRAESILFSQFPLLMSYALLVVINLAWTPGRIPFGYLSDCLVPWMNRWAQSALAVVLFAPFYLVVSLQLAQLDIWTVWFFLIAGEFSPALLHTMMDAQKASYFNRTGSNISQLCDRFRHLGMLLGRLVGAAVVQEYSVYKVFFGEFIALLIISALLLVSSRLVEDDSAAFEKIETNRWPGDEEEEEVIKLEKEVPMPVTRSLTMFAFFYMIVPTGFMCMFYFEYGPLGITPMQFGWIDGVNAIIPVLVTFLPGRIQPRTRSLAFFVSVTALTIAFLRLVLVSQLFRQLMSNYSLVFLIECLAVFVEHTFICYYNYGSTESAPVGSEGASMVKMSTSVTAGRVLRVGLEALFTVVFEIDQGKFNRLTELMTTAMGIHFVLPLLALFVR